MVRNCKFIGIFALVCLALVVSSSGQVFADAASDARIEKLEVALKLIQAELAEIKAEQKANKSVDQDQIETVVAKVLEDKGTVATTPAWLNKLSFGGDFRYRHETADTYADTDWQNGRSRHRLRARFKLGVEVNDEFDLNFRFTSGTMNPTSTYQTLDNSFSTKNFLLDRAYLDWHPEYMDGVNVYAGKMKLPFRTPLQTKLIWDDNINPEGGAIKYSRDLGDDTKIYFAGGGFWVDEDSGGVDTSLWGVQSYIRKELEDKRSVLGGVSYYDYGNIKNRGSLQKTWSDRDSFYGNTTVNDTYATDFNIFELFGEYKFQACDMPIAIGGDWVRNFAADSGKDTAWLVGIAFNKTTTPGTWQARYNYRDTESDAVLGAFSDAAFANGVTNSKGSEITFDYMLAKNMKGRLRYYLNERGENDDDVRKVQAEVRVKF
jgi:hypothetical protein